jgi:hypothetical protein
MSGADYYKQALQRALGLLRQGANEQAAKFIQDALDLKLSFDTAAGETVDGLELAFDPREAPQPRCWIEDGMLHIDEEGWEIENGFLENLLHTIEKNIDSGLPEVQLMYEARQMLKQGIEEQKIRRKK